MKKRIMRGTQLTKVLSVFLAFVVAIGALMVPSTVSNAAGYIIYQGNPVKKAVELSIGSEATFFAGGISGTIYWFSSDENVAKVLTKSGSSTSVSIVGAGKCTLTARTTSGSSAAVEIEVDSFQVNTNIDMGLNATQALFTGKAKGKVKVKVKKKKICTVSSDGMIHPKKCGKTKIVVKNNGITYNCMVYINKASVNEDYLYQMVKAGDKFQIDLLYADGADYQVDVADSSVASFEGTTGTAHKKGYTDYILTFEGKKYNGRIYVVEDSEKDAIVIMEDSFHLKVGQTITIPCFGAKLDTFTLKGDNADLVTGGDQILYELEDNIKYVNRGVSYNSWYSSFTIHAREAGELHLKLYAGGTLTKTFTIYIEE